MAQKKVIQEEMQALDSVKNLAENYEEIAATRMQRIKNTVLITRDYLSELSEVFVDLKSSYPKEIENVMERQKEGDTSLIRLLQKNGKLLMVYLSSNGRLYGPVTKKTFELFIKELKTKDKNKTDVVVIGATGKELYESSSHKIPYKYVEVPDDEINNEHLKKLMEIYLQYDDVEVYYGKFGNVVKQSAFSTSITGSEVFEKEALPLPSKEERFIFEPIFEEVFKFFQTQIMSNLFRQTFYENQLARQASRVNAMEEALIHIQDETKRLNKEKTRLKHIVQNKKQLETIAGFILWNVT